MSGVSAAIARIEQAISARVAKVTPYRAIVTAVSGGMIEIQRIGAVTPDTRKYASVSRFLLVAGDEVLVANLDGEPVIIDKINRSTSAPASSGLADYLAIRIARDNTNFTNTSTVNDADAVSTTITLPAGTWSLFAVGGMTGFHTAVADYQVSI